MFVDERAVFFGDGDGVVRAIVDDDDDFAGPRRDAVEAARQVGGLVAGDEHEAERQFIGGVHVGTGALAVSAFWMQDQTAPGVMAAMHGLGRVAVVPVAAARAEAALHELVLRAKGRPAGRGGRAEEADGGHAQAGGEVQGRGVGRDEQARAGEGGKK